MAIKYPLFIFIFIALFILVFFISKKEKNNKRNNIKIANTSIIKRTEYYKSILARYRMILYLLYGVLFLGIVSSSFLSSRIIKKTYINNEKYNRDIMLCLDVSQSTDELNAELVDKYLEFVDSLKGERIGISIFNSTSYLLSPLTEDYDYIKESLKRMRKSLQCFNDIYGCNTTDYAFLINGTQLDLSRGSSLIGDGLASCIFSFPKLEEKRTRSIVLVTDNEVYGTELVNVVDAAKIAKKKDITIYTISPIKTFKTNASSLEEASKLTGGSSYSQTDGVNKVVDEINKKETSFLEGKKQEIEYDTPKFSYVILLFSFATILFIDKELIR